MSPLMVAKLRQSAIPGTTCSHNHLQLRRKEFLPMCLSGKKSFSQKPSSRLPLSFYWLGLGHIPFSKPVMGKEIGHFWFWFALNSTQPLRAGRPFHHLNRIFLLVRRKGDRRQSGLVRGLPLKLYIYNCLEFELVLGL